MRQGADWALPAAAMPRSADVTRLLGELGRGNRAVEATLIPLVYDELRHIAQDLMRGEIHREMLQTTVLVHDAYLRLTGGQSIVWESRTHFFAVAAKAMRRILVDHARARNTEKRGSGAVISAADLPLRDPQSAEPEQLLALDAALERLAAMNARHAQIVELRFFVGMNVEETAHALNISPRTVKREWRMARLWLHHELVTH